MPTPRMSQAMMDEAVEAVRAHGSVRAAAIAMSIPEETLRGRLKRAQDTAAGKSQSFTPPPLVSRNSPVQELWERRRAEYARIEQAEASRRWMPFTITAPGPFGLAFVGDPHLDDPGTDIAQFLSDLDLIEATPSLFGVGMGDWINAWAGKLQRLYAAQGATESDAWRMMQDVIERDAWLLLLLGNHDLWHGSHSPVQWMAARAPVEKWAADFIVRDAEGKAEWKVSAAHDFPGRSIYNKAHGPMRRGLFSGAEAHLYIAGDKHCAALAWEIHNDTGRPYWAARVRGYKRHDDYSRQLGYSPTDLSGSTMVAVCDPADGAMVVYPDLRLGVAALEATRIRRGFKPRARVAAGRA